MSITIGVFVLLMLSFSMASFASELTQKEEVLYSTILKEERKVVVNLPKSYSNNSDKVYPVIYRLDGQDNIPRLASMLETLHRTGSAPEVIIVAIENTDRLRDLFPTVNKDPRGPVGAGGGGAKFLNFIEKELIPYINESYRTHDFKVIAGASAAGVLALHSLTAKPDLFQAHIAYSPAVWWGDNTTAKKLKEFVSNTKELDNYLYMNIGSEPAEMKAVYEDLQWYIQNNKPAELTLVTESFYDVPHALTSAAGLFKAYHKLFLPLAMPDTKLTNGVQSIKDYYENVSFQRGEKLVPTDGILRQLGYGLVDKKHFPIAIQVFNYNIQLHPNNPNTYNGLAYALEQNEQYEASLAQVKLALQLSNPGDDGHDVFLSRKKRLLSLIEDSKG